MSALLVRPSAPGADGTLLSVTPASAGWTYVGFEVLALSPGILARRSCEDRECCVIAVAGRAELCCAQGTWAFGGRSDPWTGPPDAVYVPPGASFTLEGEAELALCWAPAPGGGAQARLLPGTEIEIETRGYGSLERTIHPILMSDRSAESLLVCEVLTPGGHWSSYPPHKHDRDAPPSETLLEETYYHRFARPRGFGFQRVYTVDRALDETLAFSDRDCVLVPRGYHTVSAPPGYDLYYLNVMAGPTRVWAVANDPDHEWTLVPQEQT